MKKAIVGKKIGMTQIFTDDGRLVPVTVVEAGPCKVVQKKNTEKPTAIAPYRSDLTRMRKTARRN